MFACLLQSATSNHTLWLLAIRAISSPSPTKQLIYLSPRTAFALTIFHTSIPLLQSTHSCPPLVPRQSTSRQIDLARY